jgi:hypothetical protein
MTDAFTRSEVAAFLARADATLAEPPRWPWVERHPGRGRLVLRFALPLALVPTANVGVRHRQPWALARERSSVLATMAGQMAWQVTNRGPDGVFSVRTQLGWCRHGRGIVPTWPSPLPGRPQLRAVRFSSRDPDATAAWWKTGGDCLLPPRTARTGRVVAGLGVLVGDDPARLETRSWGEYAAPGEGFALLEIWSGQETTHAR